MKILLTSIGALSAGRGEIGVFSVVPKKECSKAYIPGDIPPS